jgi:hypothetical protein
MDTLRTHARTPFFVTNITYYFTLGTGNFSPIDDVPVAFTDTQEEVYIKSGFLAKDATDDSGYLWCVTWDEYQTHRTQENIGLVTNAQVLALCTPIQIYLKPGEWTGTPIVKVFSTGDKDYTSQLAYINIGTIR